MMRAISREVYEAIASKPYEKFEDFLKNERFIHYMGMTSPFKPGIRECVLNIKYTHYRKENPRSALFFMHTACWANRDWIIMSVPIEDKNVVEKVAKNCGLEAILGVPKWNVGGKLEPFFVDNGRIFVLDNTPDHPIRRGDPLIKQVIMDAEREAIDRIMRS
jgi:hypothetical protein